MDRRRPRRTPLLLLAALVCPGCLIFDPTDFPDPVNVWPYILETRPPSGADWQVVDRTSAEPEVFVAVVHDDNEEDALDAHAFVDYGVNPSSSVFARVERAEQEPLDRVVTVELRPGTDFTRGCHVLEIDVADSSGWTGARDVQAGVGKVTATWFVLAHDGDGFDDIVFASCPGSDRGDTGDEGP